MTTTRTPDTFVASNGIEIEISQDGYLLGKGDCGSGPTYATAGPDGIDALREFFQHQRDQELGRWRDPENPDAVVYRSAPNSVRVLYETDGASFHCRRDDDPLLAGMDTAARYFVARPEPRPWHDAQSGELWILTIDGEQVGALAWRPTAGPQFETSSGTLRHDDPDITAGRKLWPRSDDE